MRRATQLVARLSIAALAAMGLAVPVNLVTAAPAAAVGPQTWADEFNAAAGTPVDGSKWKFDIGGGGYGNNELQYYTNSTSNVAHDGQGHLVITARKENPAGYSCWYGSCQYTSARLLTQGKFTQTYGRFEARIKIPRGQGMWPAFWMLGNDIATNPWPNNGEIDIMENIGSEPGTVHGSLHGPGYSGGNPLTGQYTLPGGAALSNDFHTYAVDWAPGSVTWYLDGVQYSRKTSADAGGNRWVFDHPFFMIMNVAVGGNWPGSPNAGTSFPQTMVVDYVRVYANDGGTTPGASSIIGTGSNRCIDIPSSNAVDGARLQIWDCNGTDAQKWTFAADGSVQALGKCMDVAAGSTADGAAVQLYTCNGTGAQKFTLNAAGDLVNPQANKCVDVTGAATGNGAKLQLWTCGGGSNQKWRKG
ncbi:hydrolase [Catellatospora sp. TT07R-123]|uniref:glycoside hydrolase family 16 protein n=1 Tax=Catellatospora sp. TT07R-123 TaxID=2733863 RepID=UPI001B1F5DD3|nr:glycoside hydrolase family 16 protein [Catellatospora sp. TT07R-123]GHJ48044.1 hydrolase [Catellatospora sp. TT07R-123]